MVSAEECEEGSRLREMRSQLSLKLSYRFIIVDYDHHWDSLVLDHRLVEVLLEGLVIAGDEDLGVE